MIIYVSSLSSFIDDGCAKWFEDRGEDVALLGSLANDRFHIDTILDGKIKCCKAFMWDSGAVSVRNKKTEIKLSDYVGWVKEIHQTEIPLTIVALDVIGDVEASHRNYMDLKYSYGFGNNFLPVFHYGEHWSYLETLIEKEGFDYIGLGGVGAGDRLGQNSLRDWLKQVFFVDGNCKDIRYPGIKFHGFAMTSDITLPMFPFHSVDSATWVKNSANGRILTPYGDFRISNDSRSGYDKLHFKRATPLKQQKVVEWIEAMGLTLDQVVNERYAKHIVNVNYFRWMEMKHNWNPAAYSDVSVLSDAVKSVDVKVKEKPKVSIKGLAKQESMVIPNTQTETIMVCPHCGKLVILGITPKK